MSAKYITQMHFWASNYLVFRIKLTKLPTCSANSFLLIVPIRTLVQLCTQLYSCTVILVPLLLIVPQIVVTTYYCTTKIHLHT